MVDLHTHSDRSDGTLSPQKLTEFAYRIGLRALAITDHDSLEGFDAALPHARRLGLELVCGVELSAKFHGRPIHILGYFLQGLPGETFRRHLSCVQKARHERNVRLASKLRELGLGVTLEEAEALGRSQTGRPHFAQVLVNKGCVPSYREAFNRYLDESAPGYVERKDPTPENVIGWIHESGGVASWAHPARFLRQSGQPSERLVEELAAKGLDALEVYHSDHGAEAVETLLALAKQFGLAVTGGSDFHGLAKSNAYLGGLNLPLSLLEELRAYNRALVSGD